jgi:glutamate dehydrogenase
MEYNVSAASKKKTVKSPVKQSEFVSAFLENTPPSIQKQFDKNVLNMVLVRHEKLGASRQVGETVIEVFNPTQAQHGWNGLHTVLNLICDDKAFIVDSVIALLTDRAYTIEHIVHPLLFVARNKSGAVTGYFSERANGLSGQSHIFVQLNRRLTEAEMKALKLALAEVYQDVHLSNQDWSAMKSKVKNLRPMIETISKVSTKTKADYLDFLDYIHDDNFTLLGYCDYQLKLGGKAPSFVAEKGAALGVLSAKRSEDFMNSIDRAQIFDAQALQALDHVIVTKLTRDSSVHRRVPLDAVLVKRVDASGKLTGISIVIGLFTSVTYSRGLNTVPFLRYKAEEVMVRAGFEGNEHGGRALRHILEKFPRDELFQIPTDKLYDICLSIMQLQEQPRIAVYFSPDVFGREIVGITYIPKDVYDTRLRIKFACILEEELNATYTDFQSAVDDSPLVRATFTLSWNEGAKRVFDAATIETRLQAIGKSWFERLNDSLIERLSNEDEAANLAYKYGRSFSDSYLEMYQARQAVHDIEKIEEAIAHNRVEVDLYRPYNAGGREVSMKIFSPGKPISLSDVLPVLENMGLKVVAEYPHEARPAEEKTTIWIQDFIAEIAGKISSDPNKKSVEAVRQQFESCLKGIWSGQVENDGLNKLILLSAMPWRDIVILRSCIRYLRQTKIPFSLSYMEQALTENPAISGLLGQLFHAKFHPDLQSKKSGYEKIKGQILDVLQEVTSIDQDRILRAVLELMDASLRTNFYQVDAQGHPKSWVSIKFDSSLITDIPDPRPYREIFVYSPRVEGVHLRIGPIARGGLRWSDRHEDFRTEVLSLVKAQNVKNAVIVPMGAKGGFVVKNPPKEGGRDAYMKEGIACYQTYIRALLDITDNRKAGKIVPPVNVVRHDKDDPYLVVAADKGTATFSDYANAISLEYGFWVGDAFASGGSAGYDHKKMGITARGAWESVKRHFREMNVNTQTEEFDVVGVGDMAGDVFGNGLLQSRKMRLIGAFNHIHIFCDPLADAAVGFKERQRLFNAVKGWDAYDASKLSKGGRIFLRSEKALTLTPEIQKRFHLDKAVVSPNELIRAMLKAQTDLLFFGGIGTYIKSSEETALDAGDRSNDALRLDASEIRAKVIGEGANLAITQRGRIEYSRKGGRINTDFIDNSAGVDTSDHEVNIKILMSDIANNPKHKMTLAARNKILAEMTDDVAGLVLRDNYQQTQAISLLEMQAADLMSEHAAFMLSLEKGGLLNRWVEFLPDDDQIEQRLKLRKGLTRPELSLIVSYGKLTYTKALLATSLPDSPLMTDWVYAYFPEKLQKKFGAEIEKHQLRREIIAMSISNAVVNRMGPTFVRMTSEKTGASVADVTTAFMVVRDTFGLPALWSAIEQLDNQVDAQVQMKALYKTSRLAERETYWLLTRLGRALSLQKDSEKFSKGIADLKKKIESVLPQDIADSFKLRRKSWADQGLSQNLANEIALLPLLGAGFDVIKIADVLKADLIKVAQVYYAVGSAFHLERLRNKAISLPQDSPNVSMAVNGLVDSLYSVQADLTTRIVRDMGKTAVTADTLSVWIGTFCPRAETVLDKITVIERGGAGGDFASLVVIEQQLRQLL